MSSAPFGISHFNQLPLSERAIIVAAWECDHYKVREVGFNRGERVEGYQKAAGIRPGDPYCVAFVTWCLKFAGCDHSKIPGGPGSACNWHARAGLHPTSPARGTIFTWCDTKKWRGHGGFVVKVTKALGMTWIHTIEANTDASGGREGDGVYRKKRLVTSKLRFQPIQSLS